MNDKSLPAPVPTSPPIESMDDAICFGIPRRRALIEKSGDERGDTRLVGGILRAAGPDDQPQAD